MVRGIARDDRGASAVEYGLILAAIAAVIVIAVTGLGGLVRGSISDSCGVIETTRKAHDPDATASC